MLSKLARPTPQITGAVRRAVLPRLFSYASQNNDTSYSEDYGDSFQKRGNSGGSRYRDSGDGYESEMNKRTGGDRGYGGSSRNSNNDGPRFQREGGGREGGDYKSGTNFQPRQNQGFGSDVGSGLKDINWDRETMRAYKKDLYSPHPSVSERSEEANTALIQELKATVRGRDVPRPIESFDQMTPTFGDKIMQEISAAGFATPSPVQKFAWPIISSGRDSVGVAQTGSGKTLSYMLPALNHIQHQDPLEYGDGPIALVMGPTRELVSQIQQEAVKFGHLTGIKNAVAYGGEKRFIQAQALRQGAHILIACPGRLLDFVESGVINLKRVTYLVLDEADRMLDMGFEKDIRKIVGQCRPDRQTLMFSATWPKEIQTLARDFCREAPTMVTIGSTELQCNPDIVQEVRVMPELERREHFFGWLEEVNSKAEVDAQQNPEGNDFSGGMQRGTNGVGGPKVLVFTDTKRGADALQRDLRYRSISSAAIHGNKEQRERERVLHDFRAGKLQVLVATDVAQRGLDIKDIRYVVNFDLPKTVEDYVHRIGRTGRAGAKGTAITYFSYDYYVPEKVRMAKAMCGAMADVGQEAPRKLKEIASQRG